MGRGCRDDPVLASGHSEKHAETRKKQAKIALRLRGPAAPSLRKVAFFKQNVANTPWYVPGVLLEKHGFLGVQPFLQFWEARGGHSAPKPLAILTEGPLLGPDPAPLARALDCDYVLWTSAFELLSLIHI